MPHLKTEIGNPNAMEYQWGSHVRAQDLSHAIVGLSVLILSVPDSNFSVMPGLVFLC